MFNNSLRVRFQALEVFNVMIVNTRIRQLSLPRQRRHAVRNVTSAQRSVQTRSYIIKLCARYIIYINVHRLYTNIIRRSYVRTTYVPIRFCNVYSTNVAKIKHDHVYTSNEKAFLLEYWTAFTIYLFKNVSARILSLDDVYEWPYIYKIPWLFKV